jgi:hypothetical protein
LAGAQCHGVDRSIPAPNPVIQYISVRLVLRREQLPFIEAKCPPSEVKMPLCADKRSRAMKWQGILH